MDVVTASSSKIDPSIRKVTPNPPTIVAINLEKQAAFG